MRARQLVESGIAVASRPLLRNNASVIETYEAKPIGSNDAVFHSLEAAAVMNQRGGDFFRRLNSTGYRQKTWPHVRFEV